MMPSSSYGYAVTNNVLKLGCCLYCREAMIQDVYQTRAFITPWETALLQSLGTVHHVGRALQHLEQTLESPKRFRSLQCRCHLRH